MRKLFLITIFFIFLNSYIGNCTNSDMKWAFELIPDNTYMVSEISSNVYINPSISPYLKKIFPKIYREYLKNLDLLSYASSIIVVVPDSIKKTPLFIVGIKSYDKDIIRGFKTLLQPDEIIYPIGKNGFIKGEKNLIKKLINTNGGSYFLNVYKKMRNPLFWMSFKIEKNEKKLLTKTSLSKLYPLIGNFLNKLTRIDFVVYKTNGNKHLSLNFTTNSNISYIMKKISKFSEDFKKFLNNRSKKDKIPPFIKSKLISFNYKKLKSGVILDISSFPDSLGEIFISLFIPKKSLNLNNCLTLGTLSQLIMRYDRASMFYNKAYIEVKNIYNRKIEKLMIKQESYLRHKNKLMANKISEKISNMMIKKKEEVAIVMDLSLSSMYLSGKVKEVRTIIKMAGKKANLMYKNTVKLIEHNK